MMKNGVNMKIDNESVIRNKTFVGATLNKLTLADFFILKNG